MIDWRDPDGRLLPDISTYTVLRWFVAAALIVATHAVVIWLALHWHSAVAAPGEPPPAVMIDLAPVSVASDAPPQDVAPGPQMTEAEPESTPEPPDTSKPDRPPEPEAATEPEVNLPDLPKPPDAAAVLTAPPPQQTEPEPTKPEVSRPAKQPPKKPAERKKPREPQRHAAPRTSAPPPSLAQRADRAAAPASGAASSPAAAASWKSELVAHLNRYKRFPAGAASNNGTATIAFTVSRSGHVLSSRLLRSSGDSMLDAEAVALPRRASPVPAPPSGSGGSVGLTVPIRFSR